MDALTRRVILHFKIRFIFFRTVIRIDMCPDLHRQISIGMPEIHCIRIRFIVMHVDSGCEYLKRFINRH